MYTKLRNTGSSKERKYMRKLQAEMIHLMQNLKTQVGGRRGGEEPWRAGAHTVCPTGSTPGTWIPQALQTAIPEHSAGSVPDHWPHWWVSLKSKNKTYNGVKLRSRMTPSRGTKECAWGVRGDTWKGGKAINENLQRSMGQSEEKQQLNKGSKRPGRGDRNGISVGEIITENFLNLRNKSFTQIQEAQDSKVTQKEHQDTCN